MYGFVAFLFFFACSSFGADQTPSTNFPSSNTYIPPGQGNVPEVRNAVGGQPQASPTGGPTRVNIPTPDTIPPPSAAKTESFGQYRNSKQEVKLEKLILDRYRDSVVNVIARDLAGNELARSLGVGVGRNPQYIAAPLSVVLGNAQQWADKIEIVHYNNNTYTARVAFIDEERNLVLLAPEANPAPLNFVSAQDERPQVQVFMISFDQDTENPAVYAPKVHRGTVAAANAETGVMSISSKTVPENAVGTAVLDSGGKLLGMLLPGGRGVLSSTIQQDIAKAARSKPFEPSQIGAILGRGVLVDAKSDNGYKTIGEALAAVKKGDAPKADTDRYVPAKNRALAPKENDKVVVKVMPGTYKEKAPINIQSYISLAGSGPEKTVLLGSDPEKPVVLIQNAENVSVSGFRIIPAALQKLKAPGVIISKGNKISFTGNIIEAKGGVGLWANDSNLVSLQANVFPKGDQRGISCDRSNMVIEANAFLGNWPYAISADKNCIAEIRRNLFYENNTGVGISALAKRLIVKKNTFVRTFSGIKVTGASAAFNVDDNLFYEGNYGFFAAAEIAAKSIGKNATWKSKIVAGNRTVNFIDVVRTEPKFNNPGFFDFRIKVGSSQNGTAGKEAGTDLGAYQQVDFLGPNTQNLARVLSVAVGDPDLLDAWGL